MCPGHNERIDQYGFCCMCAIPGKIQEKKKDSGKKKVKDFDPNF